MTSPWPRHILERACALLKIEDVDAHEVFYASTSADYVDEDAIQIDFEDNDLIVDDMDRVTQHIHSVTLPPGLLMVGVQKINRTGPERFVVINGKEE